MHVTELQTLRQVMEYQLSREEDNVATVARRVFTDALVIAGKASALVTVVVWLDDVV